MPIDKKAALEQIDVALKKHDELCRKYGEGNRHQKRTPAEISVDYSETSLCLKATIDRVAPPGTIYREIRATDTHNLAGGLKSLRNEYQAGYLQTVEEMIHGATFADFLDMASQLVSENKPAADVAAAVITGGVLEQHLRALCVKHGVPTTFSDKAGNPQPKMINAMNTELYKPAAVYAQNFMQQITAWAVIRNDAAHGEYAKVNHGQVDLMIAGLRQFMITHPA